jgi:crotonobetainyl-CoA:carnitine CoA-transferase CaiB-like acyl-CoA transferase
MTHAAVECCSYFELDGIAPDLWDKYSGVYRCADGWVRIHANFEHHRDGALALLGLKAGEGTSKADAERALRNWRAQDFENTATEKGLVVAALRARAQWEAHPHFPFIANAPLIAAEQVCVVGTKSAFWSAPRFGNAPLEGLRVLDLTRILAGPVAGRALAVYGADVMLVNSPHLPNIEAIAETSRGKRSVHLDLQTRVGRETLRTLIQGAHVLVQGYRPGGLAALGFSPEEVARINPNIVYVSLSAYGDVGPWGGKRGFDSLVQTATGLNHDESTAAGLDLRANAPRAFPYQILDLATGYLIAFAALSSMIQQKDSPGAIHAKLSLARTAEWVRAFGRVANGFAATKPSFAAYLTTEPSGFGALTACSHSGIFSRTRAKWVRPSMTPGSHRAVW